MLLFTGMRSHPDLSGSIGGLKDVASRSCEMAQYHTSQVGGAHASARTHARQWWELLVELGGSPGTPKGSQLGRPAPRRPDAYAVEHQGQQATESLGDEICVKSTGEGSR